VNTNNWTREQVLVALNLYCQLPFGKLHNSTPLIIETAKLIGRTPSSLAMKLSNLASLDPAVTGSGRKGLAARSKLDEQVWGEFMTNPDAIGYESQVLMDALATQDQIVSDLASDTVVAEPSPSYFAKNIETTAQVRVKQSFFRKAVLSSYQERCCMTGLANSKLLVASHIVPWSKDEHNRLNPSNGLCLSALHDKAYDCGLITVTPDFGIKVSEQLRSESSELARIQLLGLAGQKITLPQKFLPNRDFLAYHAETIFIG
jgi:hypothetical protein